MTDKSRSEAQAVTSLSSNNVIEYFTVQGVTGSNAVTIKSIGAFKPDVKVRDTIISRFLIEDSLVGEIVVCNLSPYYLASKKSIPILYVNILDITQIMRNNVMQLYLYIDLPYLIDTRKDIYDKTFKGKFRWTKSVKGKEEKYKIKFMKYPGNEKLLKFIQKITKNKLLKKIKEVATEMRLDFQKSLGTKYSDEAPKTTVSLVDNEDDDQLEDLALKELGQELSKEEYEELLKELEKED
jgi:hypothetical protein